jgi:hypothetical protein
MGKSEEEEEEAMKLMTILFVIWASLYVIDGLIITQFSLQITVDNVPAYEEVGKLQSCIVEDYGVKGLWYSVPLVIGIMYFFIWGIYHKLPFGNIVAPISLICGIIIYAWVIYQNSSLLLSDWNNLKAIGANIPSLKDMLPW